MTMVIFIIKSIFTQAGFEPTTVAPPKPNQHMAHNQGMCVQNLDGIRPVVLSEMSGQRP